MLRTCNKFPPRALSLGGDFSRRLLYPRANERARLVRLTCDLEWRKRSESECKKEAWHGEGGEISEALDQRAPRRDPRLAQHPHTEEQREKDDVGESILPRRSLAFSSSISAASAWDPGQKVSSWPTKPIKKVGSSGKR